MSITVEQVRNLTGKVYGEDSEKIGSVGEVYLDDASGVPSWVTVKTGLFGTGDSFVPLEGARIDGEDVYVGYGQEQVKNAPRVEPDGSLSPAEEEQLYDYYGLSTAGVADVRDAGPVEEPGPATPSLVQDRDEPSVRNDAAVDASAEANTTDARDTGGAVGHDTSGPTTDDAMTRSEEELSVGTATREAGRARLRKYVTTEHVTQTVPVQHEEVVVEREPITAANAAAAQTGPQISEEEHEIVLHEEVPVVDKQVRPVERVRLDTETVTEQADVDEDLRKEQIETVDDNQADERADRR